MRFVFSFLVLLLSCSSTFLFFFLCVFVLFCFVRKVISHFSFLSTDHSKRCLKSKRRLCESVMNSLIIITQQYRDFFLTCAMREILSSSLTVDAK